MPLLQLKQLLVVLWRCEYLSSSEDKSTPFLFAERRFSLLKKYHNSLT